MEINGVKHITSCPLFHTYIKPVLDLICHEIVVISCLCVYICFTQALKDHQVVAVHIDNGFMRKDESESVKASLERIGLDLKGIWVFSFSNCENLNKHVCNLHVFMHLPRDNQ